MTIFFGADTKFSKFPGGELHVEISDCDISDIRNGYPQTIWVDFNSNDDLFYLAFLVDAIRIVDKDVRIDLEIPYFPYARQDRSTSRGTSFALKVVVDFINNLNLNLVTIKDPHSVVLPTLLNNCVIVKNDYSILEKLIQDTNEPVIFLSPDAGAVKRTQAVAEKFGKDMVIANKKRDPANGKILKTEIFGSIPPGSHVIIVDDICDGGRTFIELAKALNKEENFLTLHLFVTFGIFSKGRAVLEEHFDSVNAEHEFWSY